MARHAVNQITWCKMCLRPLMFRDNHVNHKATSNLKEVLMFSFNSILSWSIGTRCLMKDFMRVKVILESGGFISESIIWSENFVDSCVLGFDFIDRGLKFRNELHCDLSLTRTRTFDCSHQWKIHSIKLIMIGNNLGTPNIRVNYFKELIWPEHRNEGRDAWLCLDNWLDSHCKWETWPK